MNFCSNPSKVGADHRVEMCKRLCASSEWLSVSTWEADKPKWTPTVESVQYHAELAEREYEAELRLLGE